ncbi:flagellin FlaB [Halorientalis persicus]|uniref:Flagellin FlaB n=1 Tax=Halorientalis persicus TaxID=1367881 RepID=A0A1H8F6Z8_9EURY|nr:hypothetical protein [Halorientalis persicus]SEN26927.1 flagellin FlaB [Halorientalis persicus]
MYQRRTVLRAGVTATALAVAGCTSQDDATDATSDGTDDDGVDETDDAAGTDSPEENTDTDEPTETATDGDPESVARVRVISSVGLVADGAISAVELVVAPTPGAGPADLRRTTVQWVDERGSYDLAAASSDTTADGTFRITPIKDADDSAPVLNADDDRMQLSMDLGAADEVSGVEGFGEPLQPGATATLQLTTAAGATSTVRLTVPETLAGERAVTL